MGRSGRPWGELKGGTDEINELALLLQEQLRRARMSVRELCEAFEDKHFPAGTPPPSRATVSRRLTGIDLLSASSLIDAIITICVPPGEVESVRQRATDLQRQAAKPTPRVRVATGADPTVSGLRSEIDRLRQQLLATQDELLAERRHQTETRRSEWNSAAIVWLLASHHARAQAQVEPGASATVVANLERDLRRTEKERDAARSALAIAQRRIRDLEAHRAVDVVAHPPAALDTRPERTASGFVPHATRADLETLERALRSADPDGSKMAAVLRRALDFPLDGSRTGRFRWDQLSKVERATVGTRVEIELRREFGLERGAQLAFTFGGIEFDCQYSTKPAGWMIAPRAAGGILLLLTAEDRTSTWSGGLVRADPELLNVGRNRDGKITLSVEGRKAIRWLHRDAALPNNVLVHLPQPDLDAIFAPQSAKERIAELLRRAQRQPISRTTAATVALQDDYGRRVREAHRLVAAEGIVLLNGSPRGQQIARVLHLPVPAGDEWISVRLTPWDDHDENTPFVEADGLRWVLAKPDDPVLRAPDLLR